MKGLAARIITALDLMPTSNQLTENQHVKNLLHTSEYMFIYALNANIDCCAANKCKTTNIQQRLVCAQEEMYILDCTLPNL